MKYIEFEIPDSFSSHLVCIINGYIIDGSFKHMIKLSEDAIKEICRSDDISTIKTYSIEQTPARERLLAKKKQK